MKIKFKIFIVRNRREIQRMERPRWNKTSFVGRGFIGFIGKGFIGKDRHELLLG